MEPLVTVQDVKARYKCSSPTARKYIRQCNPHMEHPLVTYSWAFREWEQGRTVAYKAPCKSRTTEGRVIVPRRRS